MALTAKQIQALRLVADQKITGQPIKYAWRFTDHYDTYTAAVMALSAKALVTITYYRTVAGVDLTERGRAIASKAVAA